MIQATLFLDTASGQNGLTTAVASNAVMSLERPVLDRHHFPGLCNGMRLGGAGVCRKLQPGGMDLVIGFRVQDGHAPWLYRTLRKWNKAAGKRMGRRIPRDQSLSESLCRRALDL